jgi:hypothetical protein
MARLTDFHRQHQLKLGVHKYIFFFSGEFLSSGGRESTAAAAFMAVAAVRHPFLRWRKKG